MATTRKVAIGDLKVNLFVRKALNQDHILFLAELIENSVKLPPIQITLDGIVVDGRHRVEAHELNNLVEIEAEIVSIANEKELIAQAYRANVGGSLPPTSDDTEHTIALLLERGEAKKRIGEMLGLPPGMARRYVNQIQSKLSRAKVQQAVAAVAEGGLTVNKASEQYGADLVKVKEALTGQRTRRRKEGVAEIKSNLTFQYRSVSQKNARLMRALFEKLEDGDVTPKQVAEILTYIEKLQKQSSRAINDWKKRFEAKISQPANTA